MNEIDLAVDLCGCRLPNPTVLASGILGLSHSVLARVARSGAGAVTTKSCSLKPRSGYPNPTILDWGPGLINAVGFSFSANKGKLLENLVFLQLRRNYTDIYYYKTDRNHEVDFFIPSHNLALQVCQDLSDESTKEREVRSLVELAEEQGNQPLLQVITLRDKDEIQMGGTTISVLPLYEWLLNL